MEKMKSNIVMDWAELKHRISRLIVDFTRSFGISPNVVVLGRLEYDILQDDEAKEECLRGLELDSLSSETDQDEDSMINGEIVKIWDMEVCKVDKESLIEMGYVRKI